MKKLALCIGINNYPGTGSDLSGCINNVNVWAAELRKRGYAVTKLINKKATRKGIMVEMTVAKFAHISTPATVKGGHAPQRKVRFMPPGVFLSMRSMSNPGMRRALRNSSPPGRYGGLLMSGCMDSEYSYDAWFNGKPNGAFTFVALNAAKDLKKTATYSDWHKSIQKNSSLPVISPNVEPVWIGQYETVESAGVSLCRTVSTDKSSCTN